MKRILVVFCLIALCIGIASARVYDKRNRIFTVTVNTYTAVVGGGWLPGRVYYFVENQSLSYSVKRATWAIDQTDAGQIIGPVGGWWEDKYNVYQSTWYYIISGSDTGTADILIHERD